MWIRVAAAVGGAFVGYIVGGLLAGLIFLLVVHEASEGGTGNSRYGMVWFAIGGLIGAVIAGWFAVRLAGRVPNSEEESDSE